MDYCSNLPSNDLSSLVGNKRTEHRVAISRRSDLHVEINDELVQHGECEVLRAIPGNANAQRTLRFAKSAQYYFKYFVSRIIIYITLDLMQA